MDIAMRLDQAMKAAGIRSQSALARASGVPQPTINRILKGVGKKGPEAHTLKQLAIACNVSFQWLHEGVGPMVRGEPDNEAGLTDERSVSVGDGSDARFVKVPLIEMKLQAGVPGFLADPEYNDAMQLSLPQSWVQQKRLNPARLVAMKVKGDSMYPTLNENDTVIINTADQSMVDGVIFAVNYDGKAVVKRLERDGGIWYLSSDNTLPAYKRRVIRDSETMIIGRVVRRETDWI